MLGDTFITVCKANLNSKNAILLGELLHMRGEEYLKFQAEWVLDDTPKS